MDRIATKVGAGALVVMTLLGLGACGGDGDDEQGGGLGLGGDAGSGDAASPAPGSDVEVCRLLEVPEIEQQFGERGTVADGVPNTSGSTSLCSWDVGDLTASGSGTVTLGVSPDVSEAIFDELTGEPVEGLGDEALISSGATLHVRSGGMYFNLIAGFYPDVPDTPAKLTSLGEAILDRL